MGYTHKVIIAVHKLYIVVFKLTFLFSKDFISALCKQCDFDVLPPDGEITVAFEDDQVDDSGECRTRTFTCSGSDARVGVRSVLPFVHLLVYFPSIHHLFSFHDLTTTIHASLFDNCGRTKNMT